MYHIIDYNHGLKTFSNCAKFIYSHLIVTFNFIEDHKYVLEIHIFYGSRLVQD